MLLADLHCHLLPGVDDGAADEADAVAMARQAEQDGIGVICATPHIRADHDVRVGELRDRVARLNVLFAERRVPVAVATGGEVAEAVAGGLDPEELVLVSLGGHGRWILLEPSPGPLAATLNEAVDRLAQCGLRAVVAHPERHVGPDFRERLAALVARGALVQATAAHVLDDGAGPVLCALAREGLVHLVASDAHSGRHGRPVALRAAIARVADEAGEAVARFMAEAPADLLAGRAVAPPQTPAGAGS